MIAFDVLIGLIVAILAGIVVRAWRHGARDLKAIQRLAAADDYPVRREQGPLGSLVVVDPRMEAVAQSCPGFCEDLADCGDPRDCTCTAPCGRQWCTALRRQRAQERGLA